MRREWMVLGLGLLVGGYSIGQWQLMQTGLISAQESPAATADLVKAKAATLPLVEQYVEAARQKFLALNEQQQRMALEDMQAELKQSLAEKRLKELQAELRKLQAEFPATTAAQIARSAADLIESPPMARVRVQEMPRPTLYSPEGVIPRNPAPTLFERSGFESPNSEEGQYFPQEPIPDPVQPNGFGPSS